MKQVNTIVTLNTYVFPLNSFTNIIKLKVERGIIKHQFVPLINPILEVHYWMYTINIYLKSFKFRSLSLN